MFLENTVNQQEQFGWIEVICGSMFSGKNRRINSPLKTLSLLNKSRNLSNRLSIQDMTTNGGFAQQNEIRSTPVPVAENIRIFSSRLRCGWY